MTYEEVKRGNQRKKERGLRKEKEASGTTQLRTAQGTVTSHVTTKGIHNVTARTDLQMVQQKFLTSAPSGKRHFGRGCYLLFVNRCKENMVAIKDI